MAGVDAIRWIELQHNDPSPILAMTPLIIMTDYSRLSILRYEEMPDRIMLLQNRADTLNHLTRSVKRILRAWGLDQAPMQAEVPLPVMVTDPAKV